MACETDLWFCSLEMKLREMSNAMSKIAVQNSAYGPQVKATTLWCND